MKRYASTLFVFLLTACAAQTGVVNIGQDTYMVGRQGWICYESVIQLKGEAFQEAARFCTFAGQINSTDKFTMRRLALLVEVT